ncbi:MAG: hypothetical protein JJ863_20830 [Deltaproteobacteria bacterium]|nr:hypothetical protein [Deltaproteobacteria bacterium]
MRKRVRAVRSQASIRRFEYRQRNLAKGTWAKVRRELALTERVFALSEEEATALEARGRSPLPAGLVLHPQRHLYCICEEDLAALGLDGSAQRPVAMDTVLDHAHLALLPFSAKRDR